jgi:hypothetical protein
MLVALDQVFGVIHDVATEGDYSHNPMSDIINRVEKLQQDIYIYIYINISLLTQELKIIENTIKNLRLARGRQFSTNTSIRPKTRRPVRVANKKGPKKLKSWPLLAAQKVYKLRSDLEKSQRLESQPPQSPSLFPIEQTTKFHYVRLCQQDILEPFFVELVL